MSDELMEGGLELETPKKKPGPKKGTKRKTSAKKASRDKPARPVSMKATTKAEQAHERVQEERIPMGATFKLGGVTQDPNYFYYWIKNMDGRLAQARQAAYEDVVDEVTGNPIIREGGKYPMHLMRLPMKYRLQDLERKNRLILGNIKEQSKVNEGEYIPGEQDGSRSHVLERDEDDFDPLVQIISLPEQKPRLDDLTINAKRLFLFI